MVPPQGPMNSSQIQVIDPILTTVVQGYMPPDLVGSALFPRVPVQTTGGQVLEFGKEAFKQYATRRAPGTATKRITFGYLGKHYSLENHSLEAPVPREFMRDASKVPGIDLGSRATKLVMNVHLLELEIQAASIALNVANYDINHLLTLSGSSKWTDSSAEPGKDVGAAREAIRSSCGLYPNLMLISAKVFEGLRDNPQVQERFKYTGRDSITADMIARMWNLERIVVGGAVTSDDAGNMSDVWGMGAVLAYVPTAPMGAEQPSYGYTYTMEGHPLVEVPYWDNNAKSWIYGVSMERVPVLSGIVSGFLIQN